jgi:16S rRNA (uracil1498-N3)-methyltransferase
MSLPRFYVPDQLDAMQRGRTLELPADEANHASRVLRLGIDQTVELFDGLGTRAIAQIAKVDKRSVQVLVSAAEFLPNDASKPIVVAVSLPKSDRQRQVIETITALGATAVVPIKTARSVAQPTDKALERLRRFAVESCKQCGRNRLPVISDPQVLSEFSATRSGTDANDIRWIAHPYLHRQQAGITKPSPQGAAAMAVRDVESISIVIGPEGGLTDEEVQAAVALGWQLLQLGPRILRVETALAKALTIAAEQIQPSMVDGGSNLRTESAE